MLHTVTEGIGTVYWWILDHLFLINIIFALLIIFFQRRNPTTVWAWPSGAVIGPAATRTTRRLSAIPMERSPAARTVRRREEHMGDLDP